jgi:membrane protease YdiL (CAAX protease family)
MAEGMKLIAPFEAWLAVAIIAGALLMPILRMQPRGWPPQRLRALAWDGTHVAAAFVVFWFMSSLIYPLIDAAKIGEWFFGSEVPPRVSKTLAMAAAGTLALPLQLLAWRGLLATVEPFPARLVTPRHTSRDMRAGYATWLVITPVVYGIGMLTLLVQWWIGGQAEQHPLLKMFDSGPVPTGVILLLVAEAVIAAPVREELLFRGILLPWLAKREWGGDVALMLAAGVGVALRSGGDMVWSDPGAVASRFGPALLVIALAPLARPMAKWRCFRRILPIRDDEERARSIRAVVGSAALFACVHSNVWPTPIPLAVLALALGWLAVRTQSIIGPIVAHILFNTVAFTELAIR